MTLKPPKLPSEPVPQHVAIIMDGNGRWASSQGKARPIGHHAGVKTVRRVVRAAVQAEVKSLTLFAFSQENWQRPELEVKLLMQLFVSTLAREAKSLHKNGIRLQFIGEHSDFPQELRQEMQRATTLTASNSGLTLVIAVGYGGQWDIAQAAQKVAAAGEKLTVEAIEGQLSTRGLPAPDLLIRTGGEQRISNFLLWQLAYTELYFCDILWPDFSAENFADALVWYAGRERRFGRVPEAA